MLFGKSKVYNQVEERGSTVWVTTKCFVPMFTMRSMGWPPIFIWTTGSWGPRRMEPSLSYSPLIAFQACQSNNVFLPGTGSPAHGLIFSLDNLASASGLRVLLGVPGPLGQAYWCCPHSSLGWEHPGGHFSPSSGIASASAWISSLGPTCLARVSVRSPLSFSPSCQPPI
jgi:hypothetical protein